MSFVCALAAIVGAGECVVEAVVCRARRTPELDSGTAKRWQSEGAIVLLKVKGTVHHL